MKIFTGSSIRNLDKQTIELEPVSSVDLMERAANGLLSWIMEHYDRSVSFLMFCGPGNNGGDGLALARLLTLNRFKCEACVFDGSSTSGDDRKVNYVRLASMTGASIRKVKSREDFPLVAENTVIIDSLFGTGLSNPLTGIFAQTVDYINNSRTEVLSVDMPSGLFSEQNPVGVSSPIVRATHTLTFQFPKISFMFPENEQYTGRWNLIPIGISETAIASMPSQFELIGDDTVSGLLKKRRIFAHKGDFGHGLIIGGSTGKIGAVVLGARAALRSGIGLVTCNIPASGNSILQTAVPEAMTVCDPSDRNISTALAVDPYDCVAVGPGLGTSMATTNAFDGILRKCRRHPLVIDADGLNIIAANKDMYSLIPPGTILTPHPREFERLAGRAGDSYARLNLQIEFSKKFRTIVVQKGAHTIITGHEGHVWFNSTGNPGMATAGCGDVLTGIILSLLAQGYEPLHAAIAGVYIHGLAGDMAAEEKGYEALIASDITDYLGKAFTYLKSKT
jgi:NAD(P)H-hydrate epimerase